MCWNAEISLSTFVLASAAILVSLINNGPTRRELGFTAFFFTVAAIQLVEFFTWRYGLKSQRINRYLSLAALAVILAQPLAASLLIENREHRRVYLAAYGVWFLAFLASAFVTGLPLSMGVAKNGHLRWDWMRPASPIIVFSWVAFLCTAFFLSSLSPIMKALAILVTAGFASYTYFRYSAQGAWGSVYCSMANIVFVAVLAREFFKQYCSWKPSS